MDFKTQTGVWLALLDMGNKQLAFPGNWNISKTKRIWI
jgi:hypothetical protein